MSKLRLDPDALRVETFEAAPAPAARGTVHGHATRYWELCNATDPTMDWQAYECQYSNYTCPNTCNQQTCAPGCGGGGGGTGGTGTGATYDPACLVVATSQQTCTQQG